MNGIIKISLIAITVLTFAACNNGKQNGNTKLNTVTTDTAQTTRPLKGEIALEKLPPNIKKYVDQNFQGYVIKSAAYDPLCTGEDAIDVAISKKGSPDYSLIFLLDGTFVQQEEDIDISKAPARILEVVKTKYAGFTPAQQIERLTLADKSTQYLFDLTKDKISKEVIFKEDGTVFCEN